MMQAWVDSGLIAALILALTGAEVVALTLLRRRLRDFLPNILAGDFLLLAWIFAAGEKPWIWTAGALLGALFSHAADLARR